MTETVTFIVDSPRGKVRCSVCGVLGWGPTTAAMEGGSASRWTSWQRKCLQGHPFGCSCGRRFPTSLGMHNHTRLAGDGHDPVWL